MKSSTHDHRVEPAVLDATYSRGRAVAVAVARGAHLAPPHAGHEDETGDHGIEATTLEGDLLGLDTASAAPTPGGWWRGRRPHPPLPNGRACHWPRSADGAKSVARHGVGRSSAAAGRSGARVSGVIQTIRCVDQAPAAVGERRRRHPRRSETRHEHRPGRARPPYQRVPFGSRGSPGA